MVSSRAAQEGTRMGLPAHFFPLFPYHPTPALHPLGRCSPNAGGFSVSEATWTQSAGGGGTKLQ